MSDIFSKFGLLDYGTKDLYIFLVDNNPKIKQYALVKKHGKWTVDVFLTNSKPGQGWMPCVTKEHEINNEQDILDILKEANANEPIVHYRSLKLERFLNS